MTTSDSASRTKSQGMASPTASLLATVAAVAVWAVAAALRPHATYHLAPAIVMGVYPVLRWGALASRGRRAVAVAIGAAVASTTAVALQGAGLLDGPALVGATGFGEAMLIIAAVTVLGLVAALATGRTRGRRGRR